MAPVASIEMGAPIKDLGSFLQGDSRPFEDVVTLNYIPSLQNYEIISQLVKQNLLSKAKLPAGFPLYMDGPQSWTASELTESDWLVLLSDEDVVSIEAAMKIYMQKHDAVDNLSPETFPVSESLRQKLQSTVGYLFDGRGFAIVRGLNLKKYTPLERSIIFLGVSSYIGGKLGMQTLSKSAFSHLTNLKPFYAEGAIKSPGYTNVHMAFHNDTAHIIALCVAGVADNGGASMVASSSKVYNELASNKPHVIKTLAEDWELNRFSTHEFKSDAYYKRPLLYPNNGKPLLFIARRPFTGSNPGEVPKPLTTLQAEAMDCVHFTAESHAVSLNLQEGDLQYLNNLAVIHSRKDFKDSSVGAGSGRRHIIRAFIKNEERAYKIPSQLEGAFQEIYPEAPASELNFLIDPFGDSVTDPIKRGDTPPPEKPKTPPPGPTGANG